MPFFQSLEKPRGVALLIVLACLPALVRWLGPQLPSGADTALHLLRAVELEWAMAQGVFYPRYLPDLIFGYGYPLFNYYGSASQYLILIWHTLGLSYIASTLVTFALADVVGALGAWQLARKLFDDRAGFIAAIAYAYAPYLLSSLHRGSPAEAWGLALLPWLLWAFYGLAPDPAHRRLIWPWGRTALAALLYALFPLFHNPSTVLASGTLSVFILTLGVLRWRQTRPWHFVLRMGTPLLLGLGLSAFFWLPIPFEIGYIQIERGYAPAVINYHYNFLSLRELVALPVPYDALLIGAQPLRSFGLPQLLLALGGLFTFPQRTREQKVWLALSLLGILVLGFLSLPQAVWIWENLPGLSLIQFPARLLGPASLLLALLAGAAFAQTPIPSPPPSPPRSRGGRGGQGGASALKQRALALAFALIILFNLPWTFHGSDTFTPPNPTLTDIHAFEKRTGSIGTTTAGEYLPRWVLAVPPADSLAERYAQGAPISRLETSTLPNGTQVFTQTAGLLRQEVVLNAPTAFTATFAAFYFPGWRALIDGVETPIFPSNPQGLITFAVPVGAHTLTLEFGDTPIRATGNWLALGATLAWLLVSYYGWRARFLPPPTPEPQPHRLLPLALVTLPLIALRLGASYIPTPLAYSRFDGQTVQGLAQPRAIDFADQMQLLGYEAAPPTKGQLPITLYWRALQPLVNDYSITLRLVDSAQQQWAQSDTQHPAGYPTSRWPTTHYGRDAHLLALPPGLPPGRYTLLANVYRPDTLQALGLDMPIGAVDIPADMGDGAAPQTLAAPLGGVTLLDASLGRLELGVGDDLPLTLFWRVDTRPTTDFVAQLTLLAPDGEAALSVDLPPVRADYPPTAWTAGQVLQGRLRVPLPPHLADATYTATLSVVAPTGALGDPITLGTVRIHAPVRSYTLPPIAHPTTAQFGEVAALRGWDLQANRLTLYWQAVAPTDTRYTVFVHVLDVSASDSGEIYSQQDAQPLQEARPTTSWLAGEILTDEYALTVPSGPFQIRVGLYDPRTGMRLALADGSEWVVFGP